MVWFSSRSAYVRASACLIPAALTPFSMRFPTTAASENLGSWPPKHTQSFQQLALSSTLAPLKLSFHSPPASELPRKIAGTWPRKLYRHYCRQQRGQSGKIFQILTYAKSPPSSLSRCKSGVNRSGARLAPTSGDMRAKECCTTSLFEEAHHGSGARQE